MQDAILLTFYVTSQCFNQITTPNLYKYSITSRDGIQPTDMKRLRALAGEGGGGAHPCPPSTSRGAPARLFNLSMQI